MHLLSPQRAGFAKQGTSMRSPGTPDSPPLTFQRTPRRRPRAQLVLDSPDSKSSTHSATPPLINAAPAYSLVSASSSSCLEYATPKSSEDQQEACARTHSSPKQHAQSASSGSSMHSALCLTNSDSSPDPSTADTMNSCEEGEAESSAHCASSHHPHQQQQHANPHFSPSSSAHSSPGGVLGARSVLRSTRARRRAAVVSDDASEGSEGEAAHSCSSSPAARPAPVPFTDITNITNCQVLPHSTDAAPVPSTRKPTPFASLLHTFDVPKAATSAPGPARAPPCGPPPSTTLIPPKLKAQPSMPPHSTPAQPAAQPTPHPISQPLHQQAQQPAAHPSHSHTATHVRSHKSHTQPTSPARQAHAHAAVSARGKPHTPHQQQLQPAQQPPAPLIDLVSPSSSHSSEWGSTHSCEAAPASSDPSSSHTSEWGSTHSSKAAPASSVTSSSSSSASAAHTSHATSSHKDSRPASQPQPKTAPPQAQQAHVRALTAHAPAAGTRAAVPSQLLTVPKQAARIPTAQPAAVPKQAAPTPPTAQPPSSTHSAPVSAAVPKQAAPAPRAQPPLPTRSAPAPRAQPPLPTRSALVPTAQPPMPKQAAPAPITQPPMPKQAAPAPQITQPPMPKQAAPAPQITQPAAPPKPSAPALAATPKRRSKAASAAQKVFEEQREATARALYDSWNATVFGGQLPALPLVWNGRLAATAGQVLDDGSQNSKKTCREQRIPCRLELSPRLLCSMARLRSTLAHEMCHVAAWVVDKEWTAPHGPAFWKWANALMAHDARTARATAAAAAAAAASTHSTSSTYGAAAKPSAGSNVGGGTQAGAGSASGIFGVGSRACNGGLGDPARGAVGRGVAGAGGEDEREEGVEGPDGQLIITRLHNYPSHMPHRWQCCNPGCGKQYRRHRNSIDTKRHVCSKCQGRLHYLGRFGKGDQLLAPRARDQQAGPGQQQRGAEGGKPPTTPSAYMLFVKENMSAIKAAHPKGTPHKDVMASVSSAWKEHKAARAQAERSNAAGPDQAEPDAAPVPRRLSLDSLEVSAVAAGTDADADSSHTMVTGVSSSGCSSKMSRPIVLDGA